jgi:hypothetical protein
MARSLMQRRQEAECARVEAYEASLRRMSQRARPAPNFQKAIDEAKRGFEAHILRDAWAWRPQMKTRDAARLRLAAARHLFARYAGRRGRSRREGGFEPTASKLRVPLKPLLCNEFKALLRRWDFDLILDEPELSAQNFFHEFIMLCTCSRCGVSSEPVILGKL